MIPITAFALGTWQVRRLQWKTQLLAILEDRLLRPPLPLPPQIDTTSLPSFDYRRVYAVGTFLHSREMLIGPRMRDGQQGYLVVTPLVRPDGASTILVARGWIAKRFRDQRTRPESLAPGEVVVGGLLREPAKRNMFTPDNRPDKGEFYFSDVEGMSKLAGSQPVWVEATMGGFSSCVLLKAGREQQRRPLWLGYLGVSIANACLAPHRARVFADGELGVQGNPDR